MSVERRDGRPKKLKGLVNVWRDGIRDSELDRTAKLVALTLATYFNGRAETIETPPSRATLARGASLSDRSVDKALVSLEREGWLQIDPPARRRVYKGREVFVRPGGQAGPNKYAATLASTANAVRTSEWSSAKTAAAKCEKDGSQVRTGFARKLAKASESPAGAREATPRPAIIDHCPGCGQAFETVDETDALCPTCKAAA